jgi:hypothetical protein
MPNVATSDLSAASGSPQPLIERVRARVADAALALDRRARASRPRSKRSRKAIGLTGHESKNTALTPEVRSLRHVFLELGDTHRQYRRQTGEQVPPALRKAALAFKDAPSLGTLVAVAAYIEGDGILAW